MANRAHRIFGTLAAVLVLAGVANGQMERQPAAPGGPVEELFWAPTIVVMSSVTNIPKGNLNFSIMHSFGIATNGVDDLFGLDGSANIRFGLDYGVLDGLSVGVGRSRFDKLYDFRFKANVLHQSKDGRSPVEIAVKGDAGVMTLENGFDFADRLNYFAAILIGRRFSDQFSLQVMPLFSHFNTVFIQSDASNRIIQEENDHFGLGIGGRWVLSERFAIVGEYMPVFGDRSDGTSDAISVGLDIETGGHVFQLFFTSSQWLTEQHAIARNTDNFLDGDFRIGFNVNRVFGTGR
jgi:hypothetical protein